jgi:hypothetical protein
MILAQTYRDSVLQNKTGLIHIWDAVKVNRRVSENAMERRQNSELKHKAPRLRDQSATVNFDDIVLDSTFVLWQIPNLILTI